MATLTNTPTSQKGRAVKTGQTCARLRAIAHRLGPGAKMPTVQELRQEIGVSLGTLNIALRNAESRNILTRRHSVGIYVSSTLRKTVPLLCAPDFFRGANHSPFWDLLLDRAMHHDTHGMYVPCQFASTPDENVLLPPSLSDEIAQGTIDGILGIGLQEETAHEIMARGVPLVQMFGPGHVIIMLDSEAMAAMAVKTLAEQNCRRVALWTASTSSHLLPVFERILQEFDLPFYPKFVRAGKDASPECSRLNSLSLPDQGYQLALETFHDASDSRPDGLFIGDDMMTRGALIALKKIGVEVGRDVKIVSHANRDAPTLLGHEGELMLTEFDPEEFVTVFFDQMALLLAQPQLPPERVMHLAPRLRPS